MGALPGATPLPLHGSHSSRRRTCNLLGDAEDSFLELERQVLAQIGAALRARAAASTLAAKHVAEAEDVAEDVLKVVEDGGIESAGALPGPLATPAWPKRS